VAVSIPRSNRTLVMGILNVTPDSFSDGGDFLGADAAVARGLAMLAEGADIIDVGGESTRPGASRPGPDEEAERVVPVVAALAAAGATVSVDTQRASVAVRAVAAGASIVNDVSGGLTDPELLAVVADLEVGYVAQHWRGADGRMSTTAAYQDVAAEVRDELLARVDACLGAGVAAENLVLDPGLGFAKDAGHNWALLEQLDVLVELGCPLLVGASRKRLLAELLADPTGPRPPRELDSATVALTALLARWGVWGVRTHTVRPQLDAIAVAGRLRHGALA
jgi:dihydropteroate synthase